MKTPNCIVKLFYQIIIDEIKKFQRIQKSRLDKITEDFSLGLAYYGDLIELEQKVKSFTIILEKLERLIGNNLSNSENKDLMVELLFKYKNHAIVMQQDQFLDPSFNIKPEDIIKARAKFNSWKALEIEFDKFIDELKAGKYE
jgi:hypothetical protein